MFKRQWKKICRKKHFLTCRAVSSANKNGILLRGPLNFQLRVQNLVRKLRPERVRSQLQCLITTVSEAKLLQRQNLVNRDCDTPCTKDVVTSRDTDDDTRHGASNPELPTTAVAVAVDVQVEAAAQQRKEEDACKQTVMSAGYSASSEADSGGGPRRPCQLALSRDNGHAPLDQQQPIGDECSLPLLVIDSPTNTNHGSATLLCTPSPSPSPRNKSPVTVQEWVDSLPLTPVEEPTRPDDEHVEPATALPATLNETDDILTLGAEAGLLCAGPASTPFPSVQVTTCREPSEAGSHCSSVESLLEARRPDPEEVLLGLGFGGPAYTADTGRIPARFLQPSKLKGVAIDDFLRHQQDLVHNFESGYWGYRGLTGPSHTIPSVIVAKIMEKLREHERENSVASPPPQPQQQFPYHCATPQPSTHHHQHHHQQHNNHNNNNNTTDNNNKFSRVAHNLLTKIRCGSVLTPDNRKWLDSQGGSKSPELARRRLILGQQSFTFSRDGDLIESLSPPSSLTDSDRWTSSTGTTGQNKTSIEQPSKEVKVIFPSIEEDLIDRGAEDNSGDRQQATAAATPTPTHVVDNSVTSLIVDNSVTSLIVDNNNEPKLSATSSFELSEENEKQCLFSMGDSGLPSSGRSSRGLEELESPMGVVEESDECCTMNKIPEEDQGRTVSSTSQRSSRSDVLEGLYTVPPEEMIQSLDKVIESLEKIIEPLEAGSKLVSTQDENCLTRCKEQYNDLKSLTEQMSASGMDVDCGSELQFLSLTANERCALQCRVVRHALNAYHAQLTSDDMHMELKTCLGVEVQKLADLLDSTSDSDRLATIVKQMTSLLEHQTHLGQQLKGLAVGEVGGEGGQEPISCHELCEVVMRRVRSLELLVRRNARELAEIRKRSSS